MEGAANRLDLLSRVRFAALLFQYMHLSPGCNTASQFCHTRLGLLLASRLNGCAVWQVPVAGKESDDLLTSYVREEKREVGTADPEM